MAQAPAPAPSPVSLAPAAGFEGRGPTARDRALHLQYRRGAAERHVAALEKADPDSIVLVTMGGPALEFPMRAGILLEALRDFLAATAPRS